MRPCLWMLRTVSLAAACASCDASPGEARSPPDSTESCTTICDAMCTRLWTTCREEAGRSADPEEIPYCAMNCGINVELGRDAARACVGCIGQSPCDDFEQRCAEPCSDWMGDAGLFEQPHDYCGTLDSPACLALCDAASGCFELTASGAGSCDWLCLSVPEPTACAACLRGRPCVDVVRPNPDDGTWTGACDGACSFEH